MKKKNFLLNKNSEIFQKKDKKEKQLKLHKKTNEQHDKNEEGGAQTQKKLRPGGPPLEGREGRRVEPGGMGAEGSGAQRGGAQT